jgi:hypothetical protein
MSIQEEIKKDWTGNQVAYVVTNGFANNNKHERADNDYYATEPKATELLLQLEDFDNVWEICCGGGHMADVLLKHNILGRVSDIHDYGYRPIFSDGKEIVPEIRDFLDYHWGWDGDIITNPPYKYANQFIENAMLNLKDGRKLALFLPIRYTEGKARKILFAKYPPKKIWVSSGRLKCAINGNFKDMKGSAVSYAWFVWEKGYKGESKIGWFN